MYDFAFRRYRRKFIQPLQTNHGVWQIREGVIVRLSHPEGHQVGWGEIAPISWFGSESFATALDFCEQLPVQLNSETIFAIPDGLSACQFGFESALAMVNGEIPEVAFVPQILPTSQLSALLPHGDRALSAWESLWQQGYRTFKWKIGVDAIASELAVLAEILAVLPGSANLRLDANTGLDLDTANLWLYTCDLHRAKHPELAQVEFIEQPLPTNEFAAMLDLSACYGTKIALDESIASLQQLQNCYEHGWNGIYTIKPGIIGSPRRLRYICHEYHHLDLVFSSTLETFIGRNAILHLAKEISRGTAKRSLGFGVNQWFADNEFELLNSLWQN